MNPQQLKVGILGGGQLGKMLLQVANKWDLNTFILDPNEDCPAHSTATHFVKGDFKDYNTVLEFGRSVDVLTIEIENVNTEALMVLEEEGIKVFPQPQVLNTIKDKGLQKQFYKEHNIASADFNLYKNKEEILAAVKSGEVKIPFIQKSRVGGYDGKGVLVVKAEGDLEQLMDTGSVIEESIDIEKEISVIVGRNAKGEHVVYPSVEMLVNKEANLLDLLISPAQITETIENKAASLAIKVAEAFNIVGLIAVEMFLTKDNNILVNEVAPRTHNSGHHTIESCYTSQFEQQLRAILGLPLGSTKMHCCAAMLNLLGEPKHEGSVVYEGFDKALAIEGANIHVYGKKETKPFRKMGHVTVTGNTLKGVIERAHKIKDILKVKA